MTAALDLLLARADRLAAARPSWAYLRDNGVNLDAIEVATGGAYLASVVAVAPDSFAFDPDGGDAVVIEAFDGLGRPLDLVSWRPRAPHLPRRMFGRAPALGMAAAVAPMTYTGGLPLQLFRTPLEWMQAQCDGAVLLDGRAGARWLLDLADWGFADSIAPRDDAHAAEIDADRLALVRRQHLVVPVAAPPLVHEEVR